MESCYRPKPSQRKPEDRRSDWVNKHTTKAEVIYNKMVAKSRRERKKRHDDNEIRLDEDPEGFRKHFSNLIRDNGLIRIMFGRNPFPWNDIWHMAPLRISFFIRTVFDEKERGAHLLTMPRQTGHIGCFEFLQVASHSGDAHGGRAKSFKIFP